MRKYFCFKVKFGEIWIYWSKSNSWSYFYIHVVVLNKKRKIYWSEQNFIGFGREDRCSSWGLLFHVYIPDFSCDCGTNIVPMLFPFIMQKMMFFFVLGHFLMFLIGLLKVYDYIWMDEIQVKLEVSEWYKSITTITRKVRYVYME
jgi:hypothetical protein